MVQATMLLLDLPSELFAIIIGHYVDLVGAEAQTARTVSQAFNNCILPELFDKHPFCECGMHGSGAIRYRFETFLNYRIRNPMLGNHELLEYINNIVDYLIRLFPPQDTAKAGACYPRDVIQWHVQGGYLQKGRPSDSKPFKCITCSFNMTDTYSDVSTALAAAAAVGNLKAVQHFWMKSRQHLKVREVSGQQVNHGYAPWNVAAACIATGKLNILAFVLKATKSDIMEDYLYGCITSAIRCQQLRALDMLLDHIQSHAPEMLTNLPPRVKGSDDGVSWYMRSRLGIVEATRDPGYHWLFTAAATGDLEIFEYVANVIARRCNPSILTSVYAEACRHGHVALVQHLFSKGLFESGNRRLRKSGRLMRSLYTAAASGGRSILAILLEFAKNLQIGDPTLVAVERHDLIMLKYLCDNGVPISYQAVDRAETNSGALMGNEVHSQSQTEELRVYHYVLQQATVQYLTRDIASLEIQPLGSQEQKKRILTFPYRGDLEVVHLIKLVEKFGNDDDIKRAC